MKGRVQRRATSTAKHVGGSVVVSSMARALYRVRATLSQSGYGSILKCQCQQTATGVCVCVCLSLVTTRNDTQQQDQAVSEKMVSLKTWSGHVRKAEQKGEKRYTLMGNSE